MSVDYHLGLDLKSKVKVSDPRKEDIFVNEAVELAPCLSTPDLKERPRKRETLTKGSGVSV